MQKTVLVYRFIPPLQFTPTPQAKLSITPSADLLLRFHYLFRFQIHELPDQLHQLSFVRPQQLSARARCGGEKHRQVVYLRRHLATDTETKKKQLKN